MTVPAFQERVHEARRLLVTHDYSQALSCYARLTRSFPGQGVLWFGHWAAATRAWENALALGAKR